MPLDYPVLLLPATLLLALFLLLVLWVQLPRLRASTRRRRIERVVRRLGGEYLRDVMLPDPVDGHLQIDYLVLAPRSLLVLDVRPYEGAIFAGASLDAWTQMIGRRSFKFANPLADVRLRCAALAPYAQAIPVEGRVVFTREAWFPKGVPEGVSRLDELVQDIGTTPGEGEPGPKLREAWTRIKAAVQPAVLPAPRYPRRTSYALLVALLGLLLVSARLVV
ncbi:NERD domain-containing protein [Ectothiorhodospiraceae bacterium 2226]|nr:NERD domain-containing protein [Ectothiorhodospiraceae bacterium 2226]